MFDERDLNVWQNLFLNQELTRRDVFFNRRRMNREATEIASSLAVHVPSVGAGVRRAVGETASAGRDVPSRGLESKPVVMDEPTASLAVQGTERLVAFIRRLRGEGRSLLVSHNFEQVMRLPDQVWVMRTGRRVGGRRTADTTAERDRRHDHRAGAAMTGTALVLLAGVRP